LTRRRAFIRTVIVEIVFFAILHALLSAGLYAFFADTGPVFLSFLLALPFYGMYYARSTSSFVLFIAAHIGLIIWPLFLPAIWTPNAVIEAQLPGAPLSSMIIGYPSHLIAPLRICWFVFLLAAAIRSISVRLRGHRGFDTGYLLFCCGLLTALSLISGYFDMKPITALNAAWAFVIITGFIMYNQTARIDDSLEILTGAGKKPVSAIIRFNNAILAVFLIPVALFAVISPWLPLGRVMSLLGEAALAALRGLFQFIGWLISLFPSKTEKMPPDAALPAQEMAGLMEKQETPAWLALLEAIINALITILIVSLIAAAIGYGVYKLYKRFLATRGTENKEEEGGDVSEYIGPKFAPGPIANAVGAILRRLAPKTEAEKVRRLYFKKVRRHIRRGTAVGRSETTGEIADKLRPAENIDELTALYDRARYFIE